MKRTRQCATQTGPLAETILFTCAPPTMPRLDETTLADVSAQRPPRSRGKGTSDRTDDSPYSGDGGTLGFGTPGSATPNRVHDRAPSGVRIRLRDSGRDIQQEALQDARRDLRMLKATANRLMSDCDTLVQRNDVHQSDPQTPCNRKRDALHLRARADAVAALIDETERVLDQLDDRG